MLDFGVEWLGGMGVREREKEITGGLGSEGCVGRVQWKVLNDNDYTIIYLV